MKTTIKLDLTKSLTIEPALTGVKVAIQLGTVTVGSAILDAGKLGAMMFGIEQAAAAARITPRARGAVMEWLADLAVMAFISVGFIYVMVVSAAEAVCDETEAKRDATRLDF